VKTHATLTLVCDRTSEERDVEVLGVTPRCPNPSLDVRWSISGIYILRLMSNQLLAIPSKHHVRGRDPTPWRAKDHRAAWGVWWEIAKWLPNRDKKKRVPREFWPEEVLAAEDAAQKRFSGLTS
jgi:hypothetical protein